jgi:hypothetical protein
MQQAMEVHRIVKRRGSQTFYLVAWQMALASRGFLVLISVTGLVDLRVIVWLE